ncbi:FAD-dependent tricarballylate dehydrogenase TcuA [Mycobacterium basiliense]|uniref:FAD-dependent tricarballylate dehydrogenase TcuA n=1 Tax=Mycobacterium basiliense TaxID=2094119 RepID=UPI0039F14657
MTNRVIVVGAGNAALVAAIAAREGGAEVHVLEKASEEEMGGNTRYTPGLVRFAFADPAIVLDLLPDIAPEERETISIEPYPAEAYAATIHRLGQDEGDPELVGWLVSESYDMIRWLTERGVQWELADMLSSASPERRSYYGGLVIQAKNGGEGLIRSELAKAHELGVEIHYGTAGVRLLTDDSGVIGVVARGPDGHYRDWLGKVILGSGGFEASPRLRTKYLGEKWGRIKVRGTRHNTGKLLTAALDVGAQPYGQLSGCHVAPVDIAAPDQQPLDVPDRTLATLINFRVGICVNSQGRRYFDEGQGVPSEVYVIAGRSTLEQPGAIGWQIFDANGVKYLDEKYDAATRIEANTLAELADLAGIDVDGFVRTVAQYNASIRDDREFDLSCRDGKATVGITPPKSNWAAPIESGPFVAFPTTGGITFTFGGIKVDTSSRALDAANQPIPGLYAIGELTGGFFYHHYPAGTGLIRGAITGRAAGYHAALP